MLKADQSETLVGNLETDSPGRSGEHPSDELAGVSPETEKVLNIQSKPGLGLVP